MKTRKAAYLFAVGYQQKWLTFTIFVTITIFTEKVHTDFKWAKEIQWRLESWYWRSSKAACYQFWTSTWLVALFVAAQIDPKTHCDFWRSETESCVTGNTHHQPIRDKQSGGPQYQGKFEQSDLGLSLSGQYLLGQLICSTWHALSTSI